MPNCPRCKKAVYHAEAIHSLSQDWHGACLMCANETCKNKRLSASQHLEKDGVPYCKTCYRNLFKSGPEGQTAVNAAESSGTACDSEPPVEETEHERQMKTQIKSLNDTVARVTGEKQKMTEEIKELKNKMESITTQNVRLQEIEKAYKEKLIAVCNAAKEALALSGVQLT